MQREQEGAGEQQAQQPQGPLELGLLAPDVVPHLGAHVAPARAEAQRPSPLLLLLGGTGAASEAQAPLPRLSVASLPPTPEASLMLSSSRELQGCLCLLFAALLDTVLLLCTSVS